MAFRFLAFGGALLTGAAAHTYHAAPAKASVSADSWAKGVGVHPPFDETFRPFKLGEVINLSEDSAIFRFLLRSPDDVFDLKACSSLQASFKGGPMIVEQPMRSYTPITEYGAKGYFDLIVRKYPKGRMTEHLFSMEVGETLLFRKIQYKLKYRANRWKHVGMIAGGTGITSMLQVMRSSFDLPEDKTKLSLLYASRSENKILLKGLIDKLIRDHKDRCDVHYTIDRAENSEWNGFTGHINKQMIVNTMPKPEEGNIVLLCGPDPMLNSLTGAALAVMKTMSGGLAYQPAISGLNNIQEVGGILGELGYSKDNVYRF